MRDTELPDPRAWPAAGAATVGAARLHAAALAAVAAGTENAAAVADAEARETIERLLAAGDGDALAEALAQAPSFPIARHLWRLLAAIERAPSQRELSTTLAAIPVVFVSALESREGSVTLPGVLADPHELAMLLRDAREFAGAQTFALSPALFGVEAIDVATLPGHIARASIAESPGAPFAPVDMRPKPIVTPGGSERVHLRFVAAAVLTAQRADPLHASTISAWGIGFAQALARQLHVSGVSLLALPRPPQRLVAAVQAGRAVQREVSAQVFASNAIRKLRASVGEPTAIISAHRAADAPMGGELRLSLSSVFAPREAEGFRCPIYAYESVQDVAAMLTALLRDCRVDDVRLRAGVHDDIDPITGGPLLFKETEAPSSTRLQ
jgi:hypothetical protein